jgi:hypothetical protein
MFKNYKFLPICLILILYGDFCAGEKSEVILSRMDSASARDAEYKEVW